MRLGVGELTRQRIDYHVAGAGVERDDLLRLCGRRDHGDVGDAADIECDACSLRVTEEQVIDKRNQRRALAAGGDIARTEIGDHRHAGSLRDDGGFADLQRVLAAHVVDGLAVATDQID